MAVIKCKMCGGDMEFSADKTFGTCEYCGSTMTLPKLDDEQRAAAFNRGNHFRRAGEFDKALAVYERIVAEDDTDAEAHWCCALCRFGIEYVEDPATYEYLPTCHRASFDSFLEDVDYLAAVEHSDGITKRQYQKDAAKIAEVQRGILATSQNEEPYDVFLCYKETDDETKERTKDSIDAQEIYYQLTQEGYRVFFARITLEDVAGAQYEPYIFAALNSAKVMIVVGSKPEYFSAVWVKNEWSRFLALMRKDRSKLLLPCYKGMDPYDLPEQLSVLQSYDMTKIGFVQDLLRGVKKVVDSGKEKPAAVKETVVVQSGNANVAPLLERAFLFLEDGKWQEADEYCEKVLDQEPKNAEAYLGKLMAELHVRTREALKGCAEPFDGNENYLKIVRFGDDALKVELSGYVAHIKQRNEDARVTGIYNDAARAMRAAKNEKGFQAAAKQFRSISGFRDADTLAKECENNAEQCRIAEERAAEERRIAEEQRRDREEKAKAERITEEERERQERIAKLNAVRDTIAPVQHMIAACGTHTVGLKADGTVVAKYTYDRDFYDGQCDVSRWTGIVAIASSGTHTVGLRTDGTVVATKYKGEYYNGQCEVSDWKNIVAISAGNFHTVGLRSDGTVVATKYMGMEAGNSGQCGVSDWKDIVAISAGDNHTVGLKSDGTVVATKITGAKKNNFGQFDISGWTDIVAISAGTFHTVGLRSDGTVIATGQNSCGACEVSDWKNIVAISAGDFHTVGLRSDGTVVATKYKGNPCFNSGQCNVSGWKNVVSLSAGFDQTIGLKSDGTVVATKCTGIGAGNSGQSGVSGWKLFDSYELLKKQRTARIAALEAERTKLKEELSNIKGLLAGIRRGSIENRLAEIECELKRLG